MLPPAREMKRMPIYFFHIGGTVGQLGSLFDPALVGNETPATQNVRASMA